MRAGQQLVHNGLEVALFPMETINVTQGRNGQLSHQGIDAYDLAGKDSGIDTLYAPFSLRVVWKDTSQATGIAVENTKQVLLANGEVIAPRCLCMLLWHKNDISGLKIGQTFSQGQAFYAEGTRGWATGNHVHLELTKWRYDGSYPLFKANTGRWTLKGPGLNIEKCFYLNDTNIKYAMYKFKYFNVPVPSVKNYVVNATAGLRLRSEPSLNGKILTVLPYGLKLQGTTANGWLKTSYGGFNGYCSSEWVKEI